MSFIIWDNHHDCETSLNDINLAYGCPYVLPNGYRMDEWDILTKSDTSNEWGFFAPEYRPGMSVDYLRGLLVQPFLEMDERPVDWLPEDDQGGDERR